MVKKVVLPDSDSENEQREDSEQAPQALSSQAKALAKHEQSKLSM